MGYWNAVRVFNIFKYLSAQGSLADWSKSGFEFDKRILRGDSSILVFEALEIAKTVFINEAHKAVEFQQ